MQLRFLPFNLRALLPANLRQGMIVVHDVAVTAVAFLGSFYLRFETLHLTERWDYFAAILPGFLVYAAIVFRVSQLYKSKWRFSSLPDLFNIFRASTLLALSLLVLDYILLAPTLYGTFFFGKTTILLYWFLQMFFLGGPRIAYRYFRFTRTRHHARGPEALPTLILGRAADAEVLIRAIESGAVRKIKPVGILSPSASDQGTVIRGVAVLGGFDHLDRTLAELEERGARVARLLLTPSGLDPQARPEAILMRARQLGLSLNRLPSLDEGSDFTPHNLRLTPVAIEDLLLRPSVRIDYERLEALLRGSRVIVTGGGGSIGSDICDRVVTFGASHVLILENSEPALYAVLETLRAKGTNATIDGRLADIRDRARMTRLFAEFKPDIVFHAAALKHVPLLERDWGEAVKTNVFGSINVADASVAASARAMVMISTDKAIEPVSVLGATKRLAEMYCQALDADLRNRPQRGAGAARLIAVRFGNVLASNGSVVPKFKAQIEAGGPVTVTHPDMVRYFMTVREACDLVVTSASHALSPARSDVAVYVLNMGQPVRIVDLAERMIRLSGLEPGRDIEIQFTGTRPGERLHEILFAREEPKSDVGIPGILGAKPNFANAETIKSWLALLEQGLAREDRDVIYRVLRDAVPDFCGEAA